MCRMSSPSRDQLPNSGECLAPNTQKSWVWINALLNRGIHLLWFLHKRFPHSCKDKPGHCIQDRKSSMAAILPCLKAIGLPKAWHKVEHPSPTLTKVRVLHNVPYMVFPLKSSAWAPLHCGRVLRTAGRRVRLRRSVAGRRAGLRRCVDSAALPPRDTPIQEGPFPNYHSAFQTESQ